MAGNSTSPQLVIPCVLWPVTGMHRSFPGLSVWNWTMSRGKSWFGGQRGMSGLVTIDGIEPLTCSASRSLRKTHCFGGSYHRFRGFLSHKVSWSAALVKTSSIFIQTRKSWPLPSSPTSSISSLSFEHTKPGMVPRVVSSFYPSLPLPSLFHSQLHYYPLQNPPWGAPPEGPPLQVRHQQLCSWHPETSPLCRMVAWLHVCSPQLTGRFLSSKSESVTTVAFSSGHEAP